MAYNFTKPVNRYDLKRQAPLTYGARQAEGQNDNGLATGQFADVQSAQGATDRANAQRTAQGLQATRGTIARSGELSTEAALRGQDQSLAASSAQNLNATNSVNQLQRKYRNDALARSADFEANAQGGAATERNYQTGVDNTDYTRNTEARNYGANRGDVQFEQGMREKNFAAGRDDSFYGRGRDAVGDTRYDQNYKDTRGDVANANEFRDKTFNAQTGQWEKTNAQGENRFNITRSDNLAQQGSDNTFRDKTFNAQNNQWEKTNTQGENRFNLTRQDANNQQGIQNNQWDKTNAQNENRFNITRGDNLAQQGVDNTFRDKSFNAQTGQWEQSFKAGRQDATFNQGMQTKTFDANQTQQGVQNQQWNTTNAQGENRFNITRSDNLNDTEYSRTNATRLEGKGDALASINSIQDPKARQAAYNVYMQGGDVSKFITGSLYDANGGLQGGENSQYASASPGTQAYQAKLDELKSYSPKQTGESDQAYNDRITAQAQAERTQDRITSRAPATDAENKRTAADLEFKINKGEQLNNAETQDAIKNKLMIPMAGNAMPHGDSVDGFLKDHPSGMVVIDGKPLKILGGSAFKSGTSFWGGTISTDMTKIEYNGQTYATDSDGKWYYWNQADGMDSSKPISSPLGDPNTQAASDSIESSKAQLGNKYAIQRGG